MGSKKPGAEGRKRPVKPIKLREIFFRKIVVTHHWHHYALPTTRDENGVQRGMLIAPEGIFSPPRSGVLTRLSIWQDAVFAQRSVAFCRKAEEHEKEVVTNTRVSRCSFLSVGLQTNISRVTDVYASHRVRSTGNFDAQ
jgi:hypothetical protein